MNSFVLIYVQLPLLAACFKIIFSGLVHTCVLFFEELSFLLSKYSAIPDLDASPVQIRDLTLSDIPLRSLVILDRRTSFFAILSDNYCDVHLKLRISRMLTLYAFYCWTMQLHIVLSAVCSASLIEHKMCRHRIQIPSPPSSPPSSPPPPPPPPSTTKVQQKKSTTRIKVVN